MNRRDFFRLASMAGIATSAISWSRLASAATPPQLGTVPTNTGISGRVVVIGGGMGGATVAKYLRLWGGTGVSVTLVERDSAYTSNILSNLVLNGQRTITSLQYGYSNLATRYGIRMVKGDVTAIDPVGHSVTLADGSKLPYDRLIIAPGVDFDTIAGLESPTAQAKVPHAWRAGPQTTQLRNMLLGMKPGGVFVMTISGQALPLSAWPV
jgi:NADPH-dependent 2,4-dienoyl-CoA reductase/sulfur reductase-like enzyme